jgi:Trk K+ transport system NAD-binding subunit
MRAILVGAGGVGRAVLERLGDHWDVTIVDLREDRLERVALERPGQTILGDGSSRITLDRAGLDGADAVVVAVRDDDVALEVCRIAIAAKVPRVVSMVASSPRLAEFSRLGVAAVSPDRLAARRVELSLEPRRVEAAAFADGQAEAIEFRLAPDSPMVGRALADIALHGWLVAAVLREGELIVPHGRTILEAGDRVTIVGPAGDHAAMVRTFTLGEVRFPLAYGRRIGVAMTVGADDVVDEAIRFARLTAAESVVLVHPRRQALDDDAAGRLEGRLEALRAAGPHVDIAEAAGENVRLRDLLALRSREHLGCLVTPRPRGLGAALSVLGAVASEGVPVLLAAGVPGYRRLVIPARDSHGGWEAAWVALDLAGHGSLEIEALGATTPQFLAPKDDEPGVRAAIVRLRDEGSLRGVEVAGRVERGNPVRLFRDVPPDHLLVLGLGEVGGRLFPGFTPAVLARLAGSLLVVPPDPNRR